MVIAFVRYLFRPRFSPVELVFVMSAVTALARQQFAFAFSVVVAGIVASWLGGQLEKS